MAQAVSVSALLQRLAAKGTSFAALSHCIQRQANGFFEIADNCQKLFEDLLVDAPGVHSHAVDRGPGTELSKLLKRFGIEPTPTCACRAKAAQMDAWGADECSKPERIEEVVAVMRDEAAARGLPFIDAVGRMLVKRAIHNARKATIR
jgi:hypothetical protein